MSKVSDFLDKYSFLRRIFNSLPIGIYICDEKENIVFVNDATKTIDGLDAKDIIGKRIYEVYDEHDSAMHKVLKSKRDVEPFLCKYSLDDKIINQICDGFLITMDGEIAGACSIEHNTDFFREAIKSQQALQHRFVATSHSISNAFSHIIGESTSLLNCLSIATFAAQNDSSIFLTGATGTGKEVFAKAIHAASSRNAKPFMAINCAAIPETLIESILFGTTKGIYTGAVDKPGLFEQADGGTLFLDELNSMPLSSQAKLLRVLEEKEVARLGGNAPYKFDVRIISSSNVVPQKAIRDKTIREDLYYRLSVVNLLIPSLSERRSDIIPLSQYFIDHYNKEFGKNIISISDDLQEKLISYEWPGNVRQLKHCIESAMNFVGEEDSQITREHMANFINETEDLPIKDAPVEMPSPALEALEGDDNVFNIIDKNEKQEIIDALLRNKGNVTRTAEDLNISRSALNYRMQKYNLFRKND